MKFGVQYLLCLSFFAGSVAQDATCAEGDCQADEAGTPQQGSAMLQKRREELGKLKMEEESSAASLTYSSVSASQANERSRTRLLVESDLSAFGGSHYLQFDAGKSCFDNANAAFDHFVELSKIHDEMTGEELGAFKQRFIEELDYDCKHDKGLKDDLNKWQKDLRAAVEHEKPVMTKALAKVINGAGLSFRVDMKTWMLHESAKTFGERLGKKMTDDENKTMAKKTKDYYSERRKTAASAPLAFDGRTKWPACAEVIGKIHNQGQCGSCWAFGALSALDSRLCIHSNGAFSGPRAQLSRGFVSSCAKKNGCTGGLARYAYDLIAADGIVTGGTNGCKPYWGIGEGTDHFSTGQSSPPCPDSCRTGYERDFSEDRFIAPRMTQYREIWPTNAQGNIDAKVAIMQEGPISFGIYANAPFMAYSGGIFSSGCGSQPNHEVVAIGWGDGHFVGLNSWGPNWGEKGSFRVADCIVTDWTIPGNLIRATVPPLPGQGGGNFPAPTPAPPPAFAVDGDCDLTPDGCVSSANYPQFYGKSQKCTITKEFGNIQVLDFNTEHEYDVLTVNGKDYSGSEGPHGVVPTQDITWSSDSLLNAQGWKICPNPQRQQQHNPAPAPANTPATPAPTPAPTPTPTAKPTPAPTPAPQHKAPAPAPKPWWQWW
uniref:Peptidase C1A papain C-terminal domain-containing protein n=1 Tax=Alexandrium catenella TaxID=2925 RepID=A0A7S1QPE4_ALECA|mmetsp:Transcript_36342/g.98389  ORF Transcript_36342/g.98389 Transcript_36342/m.98389 type:complete len:657 (+) Transcript_36342:54-2024(+)